jgi:hypothetical protein
VNRQNETFFCSTPRLNERYEGLHCVICCRAIEFNASLDRLNQPCMCFSLLGILAFFFDPSQAAKTQCFVHVRRIDEAHSAALPLQNPDCAFVGAKYIIREEAISRHSVFRLEIAPDRDALRRQYTFQAYYVHILIVGFIGVRDILNDRHAHDHVIFGAGKRRRKACIHGKVLHRPWFLRHRISQVLRYEDVRVRLEKDSI